MNISIILIYITLLICVSYDLVDNMQNSRHKSLKFHNRKFKFPIDTVEGHTFLLIWWRGWGWIEISHECEWVEFESLFLENAVCVVKKT